MGLMLELHPAALARAADGGRSHPHRAGQVLHRLGVVSNFWAMIVAEKVVLMDDAGMHDRTLVIVGDGSLRSRPHMPRWQLLSRFCGCVR